MAVSEHWKELRPEANGCPIIFSEEEKKLHDEEIENRGYVEELVEEFQVNGILPADGIVGIVEPEDYGILRTTNLEQKKIFMSLAENESLGWTRSGPIRMTLKFDSYCYRRNSVDLFTIGIDYLMIISRPLRK
jgi:hypothetical protein